MTYQHNKVRFILLACIMALTVSGCGIAPAGKATDGQLTAQPTQIPGLTRDAWKKRWLQGIPCRLPCWEGLTPRLTTLTEATQALKQNQYIARVGPSVPFSDGIDFFTWDWGTDNEGGAAYIKNSDGTIIGISLFIVPLTLGEFIQAYGEPSDVDTYDFCGPGGRRSYSIGLLYRSLGTHLIGPSVSPDEPILDPDLKIEQINLGDILEEQQPVPEVVPWQGYKDFHFYSGTTEGSVKCK